MAVRGHYGPILCRFAGKSIGSASLLRRTFPIITCALPKTLNETNGRSEEIEMLAQAVFEEALIAEMQPLTLVGEEDKSRRRNRRLRHVVDFHAAGRGRSSTSQVHTCQPGIQFGSGASPLPCLRAAIHEALEVLVGLVISLSAHVIT